MEVCGTEDAGGACRPCCPLRGTAVATRPAPVPSKNLRREILLIETPPGKRDYPSVTDSIVPGRRASTRLGSGFERRQTKRLRAGLAAGFREPIFGGRRSRGKSTGRGRDSGFP